MRPPAARSTSALLAQREGRCQELGGRRLGGIFHVREPNYRGGDQAKKILSCAVIDCVGWRGAKVEFTFK